MTTRQVKTIERLRSEIEAVEVAGPTSRNHPHEFKEWTVREEDWGTVFVYSVTGMLKDDGTMAAIYCRTRRHIAVRKGGGCELLNVRKGFKGNGKVRGLRRCIYTPTQS